LPGWIVAASTFGVFYWLSHVMPTSDSVKTLLNAAVLAIAFLIAWSTFAIVRVMIRMTKRILRAIELGARLPKTDRSPRSTRSAAVTDLRCR
jgi:hypothetical protein